MSTNKRKDPNGVELKGIKFQHNTLYSIYFLFEVKYCNSRAVDWKQKRI